jgi:acylphosphatase
MSAWRNLVGLLAVAAILGMLADDALAAGPGGRGRGGPRGPRHGQQQLGGPRGRGGQGRGGPDAAWQQDRGLIQQLFANRDKITRSVKNLPDGVETLTQSNDPRVARLIQVHVAAMKNRLETGRPVRLRDPLFAALFSHAGDVAMHVENTPGGVHVIEKGRNPLAAKLVQAHAQVVSLFLSNGHAEAQRAHAVPGR